MPISAAPYWILILQFESTQIFRQRYTTSSISRIELIRRFPFSHPTAASPASPSSPGRLYFGAAGISRKESARGGRGRSRKTSTSSCRNCSPRVILASTGK
jgi:hypothetical protein